MFRGIPGFYSTSSAVDYTAVIFRTHLVAMKCEVFTTTIVVSSAREIQLCAWPATQLTCPPTSGRLHTPVHPTDYAWKE